MSDSPRDTRPLKTVREQEIEIVLKNLTAKNGGRKPTRAEVQQEMKRLKFKVVSRQRISELIKSLKTKGYLLREEERMEVLA